MLLPPCRPLLPAVLPDRSRPSLVADVSRVHSPCGVRLNLGWVVDLLAAIPGPHQRRIAPRAAEHVQLSGSSLPAVTQSDAHQPGQMDIRRYAAGGLGASGIADGAQRANPRNYFQGGAGQVHLDAAAHPGGAMAESALSPAAAGLGHDGALQKLRPDRLGMQTWK